MSSSAPAFRDGHSPARRLDVRAGASVCGEITAWLWPATSRRHGRRPLDDSSRQLATSARRHSLGPSARGRSGGRVGGRCQPRSAINAEVARGCRDGGGEDLRGSAVGRPSGDGAVSAAAQGRGLAPWVRACPSAMDLHRHRCLALPACQPTPDPASPAQRVPVELDGRYAPLDRPVVARPYAEQVHTDEHDQTPRRQTSHEQRFRHQRRHHLGQPHP